MQWARVVRNECRADITTEAVVERFIRGPTAAARCSYAESGLVPEAALGNPTYFVVHRWGNRCEPGCVCV